MKEERYHLAMDKYDKNIMLNYLNTSTIRILTVIKSVQRLTTS